MLFLENVVVVKLCASTTVVSKIPLKAYTVSAGYDLFADETVEVLSNSRAVVSTGLKMKIPKGYFSQISPGSGLVFKDGIVAFNGTIDSGYLGIVYVLLLNFSSKDLLVEKGNRIVSFSLEFLTFDSERGVKGFGSSGL